MISPFYSSSRERARDYPFYRLRLLFTLKTTVSLFYKGKQSAWRWSEESSINTHEHNAGHSINETADHFIKHICLTFLDVGVTHQPTQQWSMTQWYEQIKVIGFGSYPLTSLFTPLHIFLNGCAPPDGQGPDLEFIKTYEKRRNPKRRGWLTTYYTICCGQPPTTSHRTNNIH